MTCRTQLNDYVLPQPESVNWDRIVAGRHLSTNLPLYSPYWRLRLRFPALRNDPNTARLHELEGTALSSLICTSPDDAQEFTAYDDAKVISVRKTHAWDSPRGIELELEVFVP